MGITGRMGIMVDRQRLIIPIAVLIRHTHLKYDHL